MFTAHALSPDDLVRSIEGGAKAYIPLLLKNSLDTTNQSAFSGWSV